MTDGTTNERMQAAAKEFMAAAKEHLAAIGLYPAWFNLMNDDGVEIALQLGDPSLKLGIACAVVPIEEN